MSYFIAKRKKNKEKVERVKIKKFKQGKVCEICGRKNNLTVHNHSLPVKFWQVFCRDCHDKVDGIVRDKEGNILRFLKYEGEDEDWHSDKQGWYE